MESTNWADMNKVIDKIIRLNPGDFMIERKIDGELKTFRARWTGTFFRPYYNEKAAIPAKSVIRLKPCED